MIKVIQKEIRKIRKRLYYRAFDFVKAKPLTSLVISSIFAILLGVAGSLTASYIYDGIKSQSSVDIKNQPNALAQKPTNFWSWELFVMS